MDTQPSTSRRHFEHLLRHDLSAFIGQCFHSVNPETPYLPNWHIDAIADYLEATRRSEITRLLINMPPRMMKSLSVTVAWPAFLLGHDPSARILASSYSHYLSLKHAQDTRLIVSSAWFQRLFPAFDIAQGQNEKHKFLTTRNGFRFATSTGGSVTGEGGDFLIVDDPINPLQATSALARQQTLRWFDQTFSTRLNDKKKGRIIVVMQRLHAEDLSGHLIERGDWEHLCLTARAERTQRFFINGHYYQREAGSLLHPEREGEAELLRASRDLGSFGFAAQYQQQPLREEGGMMEAAWFRRYLHTPAHEAMRVVQSWDTAIKSGKGNDSSACLTFGEHEGQYYLIDALTLHAEFPALRRAVMAQAERWQPDAILIEDKASGQSLLQDLRSSTSLPVIAFMPRGDKLTRLASVSPLIESGRLHLPQQAAWLEAFEREILSFPHAAHDDQVDALSQYLQWTRQHQQQPRMRVL
ncbi:MAG: phage terminase large subunit [Rickettsiales bacterium]|nr:phage terminase large subunit [Rickettsiales bacterium]